MIPKQKERLFLTAVDTRILQALLLVILIVSSFVVAVNDLMSGTDVLIFALLESHRAYWTFQRKAQLCLCSSRLSVHADSKGKVQQKIGSNQLFTLLSYCGSHINDATLFVSVAGLGQALLDNEDMQYLIYIM